jgi:thioredoxin 2
LHFALFSVKVINMKVADSVYLRCSSCRTLNHIPSGRLKERPRCGKCKSLLDFPVRPVEGTAENFGREVFDWAGTAIVEFWSRTCGACAMIQPLLERLSYEKAGTVKVVRVNIEREPVLAGRFQIRAVPSILVYANGKLIDELHGAYPEPEMRAWLESAINRQANSDGSA